MDFKLRNFNLPENIFYFHNTEGEPLSFLLDYDTTDNFYAKLLKRHFATVVNDIDEYTMVLTMQYKSKYHHNFVPAFDIKFIEDCFTLKEYPDPTKYLIKNSCPLSYTEKNIFDCWFHHNKSWSDILIVENTNKNVNQLNKSTPNKTQIIISSKTDDNIDKIKCSAPTFPTCSVQTDKRTRMPYSHKEDQNIVEYIVTHEYPSELYGNKIWKMMEHSNVCKIRTWQSMKERFIKHIRYDLKSRPHKYPFLTPENLKLLRQGSKIDAVLNKEKQEIQFLE